MWEERQLRARWGSLGCYSRAQLLVLHPCCSLPRHTPHSGWLRDIEGGQLSFPGVSLPRSRAGFLLRKMLAQRKQRDSLVERINEGPASECEGMASTPFAHTANVDAVSARAEL